MHALEIRSRFIRLRAQGKSIRTIAEELKIAPSTIAIWNRRLNREIALARREELETALENHGAMKLQRVRAMAKAFNKVAAYLQQSETVRNDNKTYHLMIKLDKCLDEEMALLELPTNAPQGPTDKKGRAIIHVISAVPRPPGQPEHQIDPEDEIDPTQETWGTGPEKLDPETGTEIRPELKCTHPDCAEPDWEREAAESWSNKNYIPGVGMMP